MARVIIAGASFVSAATMALAQDPPRAMKFETVALDNAYVRVTRNDVPCAKAEVARCEDRVILAMANVTISSGSTVRALQRGEIAVFQSGDSYGITQGGEFYEIAIKPGHPPVKSPPEMIAASNNLAVYKGDRFFIYEEKLDTGATRPRHSHSQRVEIRLSNGPMLHQWVWKDGAVEESEPSRVNWREPIIHEVRNIGDAPLRNFILEFLPGR